VLHLNGQRHFILVGIIVLLWVWVLPGAAQEESAPAATCDELVYLMEREITPYDLGLGGGSLSGTANGSLSSESYADFWSFNLTRETNANNVKLDANLTLTFGNVSGSPLEFALFRGMNQLQPYAPVSNQAVRFDGLKLEGAYTVVVRRTSFLDPAAGSYSLSAAASPGSISSPTTGEIENVVANTPVDQAQFNGGIVGFNLRAGATRVQTHPDGVLRINPRSDQSSQVYFPSEDFNDSAAYTMHLGDWAAQMRFLGGDLAVNGADRLYYLQGFDHTFRLDGTGPSQLEMRDITYDDGTVIRIAWEQITGMWMLNDCLGFKLLDGRSFSATIAPEERRLVITAEGETALQNFLLDINALNTAGESVSQQHTLNWTGIRAGSRVRLWNGTYHALLVQDREITLQSTQMQFISAPEEPDRPGRLDVLLLDQETTISLDWINMGQFLLADGVLTLGFLDDPRTTTTRSGVDLSRVEALEDVVWLVYKDQADGEIEGEQRLLLPRSESYVELITPAGQPPFNGQALPGEPGYFPRALNNVGAECYPSNTVLPQANCPPNGHANPANGNLWYSVLDLQAFGDQLDLTVTRSYNSRMGAVDGPFGLGWSTPYLLDYNIAFNPESSSRPVDGAVVAAFPVGLDLTWAPRGIVTFITPSGSRHQFVSQEDRFTVGRLRAVTMPGWWLERTDLRQSNWVLRQDDGMVYEFDRAGRLIRYGYAESGRVIEIDYPRETIDGAGSLGEDRAVLLTDAAQQRRLELYYDANHRIIRAVLRDLSAVDINSIDTAACDVQANCFQTFYQYGEFGLLEAVLYPDGQTAAYSYADGVLTEHNDPRAPIAPSMRYTYEAGGALQTATIDAGTEEPILWQQVSPANASGESRSVTIIDEWGNSRSYTYNWTVGSLRLPETTFALLQESSPLAGSGDAFEDKPIVYEWENGLLRRIPARIVIDGDGRNGLEFVYTQNGQIARVIGGAPRFNVEYDTPLEVAADVYRPALVTYADGSTEIFTYDESGRVASFIDRQGAEYAYTWSDAPYRLLQMQRTNDNLTWTYAYNQQGQLTSLTETAPTGGTPYTVNYQWDGLGRLTGISDSLLGDYSLQYPPPEPDSEGVINRLILMTDPAGAITVHRFDARDRLVETRVDGQQGFLRRTTYDYDIYSRLTAESRWLNDEVVGLVPLTTSYSYQPQPTLFAADGVEVAVRGYTITQTDPYGRITRYSFDALDRLRRLVDPSQRISDYNYLTSETGFNLGLRIDQKSRLAGTDLIETRQYLFDLRWQLRTVRSGEREWQFLPQADSARQRALTTSVGQRTVSLAQILWGDEAEQDYEQGKPVGVSLRQAGVILNSEYNVSDQNRPKRIVDYDFLNRPVQVVNGSDIVTQIAYCPQANGAVRIIYGLPGDNALTCESVAFQQSLTYDAHDRIIGAQDSQGVRQFVYTADAENQGWAVQASFSDGEEGSSVYTWSLFYNGAGDLLRWVDASGFEHTYTYDAAGRMRSITVPDQPEASYTFSYNELDQLVEIKDGLERGFLYSYNELGRVITRLDINTADASSFTYTPTGMLSTVILPEGNTTAYLYEDPDDPTRLTGIIQPTGSQHRFEWDDDNNALVHTNPFNERTTYTYDGVGLLWRVDDPLPINDAQFRSSELYYDDDAFLTDWLEDTRFGERGVAAQHLGIRYPAPYTMQVTEAAANLNWQREWVFSPQGQLQSVDNLLGLRYDALGRFWQAAVGEQTWTVQYDAGAPSMRLLTGFNQETSLTYDALYRRVSETASGETTQYTYAVAQQDDRTVQLDVARGDFGTRTYLFFPGNVRTGERPQVTLRSQGHQMVYTYNTQGRLQTVLTQICSDASLPSIEACEDDDNAQVWERQIQVFYDVLQRPIRISDENGSLETFSYDDADNLVAYQNANGRTFNYHYDAANRLKSVTTATGIKLLIQRNMLDDITGFCRTRVEASDDYAACVEAGGEIETYTYDELARLTSRTFPNGEGTATISYNYAPDGGGMVTSYGVNGSEVSYRYDALGLLAAQTVDGQEQALTYADINQLAAYGGIGYRYDAFGRVDSMSQGSHTLQYTYQPGSYQLADGRGGAIAYQLDQRGMLTAVGNLQAPQMMLQYVDQDGVFMIWDDDTALTQSLNRQDYVREQLYVGAGDMQYYHDVDSNNLTRRQNIQLPGSSDGYVVVFGYDNDERPLTMRVTDTGGLEVLYIAAYTYNDLGQLVTENEQFLDGTQVTARFRYQNQQIIQQIITIVYPLQESGFSILGLGLLLTLWGGLPARRRLVLIVLGLGILVVLPLAAQQTGQVYTYNYSYDNAGNLAAVTHAESSTECIRFSYDSLNRLTSVTRPQQAARNYSYDANHRLVRAGDVDLLYQGSGDTLFAASNPTGTYYYGQTAKQPPHFALNGSSQPTWMLNDGRSRVLQLYQSGAEAANIWLYDPLGRYLTLERPAPDSDPCALGHSQPQIEDPTLQLQPVMDGFIWDAVSGLYFKEGQAYDPVLARFLQRHPAGPDALGYAYSPRQRANVPIPANPNRKAAHGLDIMRDALQTIRINETLTADVVRQQFSPQLIDNTSPLVQVTAAYRAPYNATLDSLLNLPLWVEQHYNQPAAYRHAETGALQLPINAYPGQGGLRQPYQPLYQHQQPDWLTLLAAPIQPPTAMLGQLWQRQQPPRTQRLTHFDAQGWQVDRPHIPQMQAAPSPPVHSDWIPEAVLPWLPTTLLEPEAAAFTFDLVDHLKQMPGQQPYQTVAHLIEQNLPALPPALPQTFEDVYGLWFRLDAFDMRHAVPTHQPNLPETPLYSVGINPQWLHSQPTE